MTNEEKHIVIAMRSGGCGYTAIAKATGLNKDTVISFCRKEGMGGVLADTEQIQDTEHCPECGRLLEQKAGVKRRRFCSTECRVKWWSKHPEALSRKAAQSVKCHCCGRRFTAYGSASRKYCSHQCYVADRFKGGKRA